VGISGLVIFLEAVISWFGLKLFKNANQNIIKTIAGVIILAIAIVRLFQVS
jgi:hypothetical protein